MSQLIKATIKPYEAIYIRQDARLVSSDSLDAERRRAVARRFAVQARYANASSMDSSDYMNQVRNAFAQKSMPSQNTNAADSQLIQTSNTNQAVSYTPQPQISYSEEQDPEAYTQQAQTSFEMEKASFEMRVATGDVSYVPSLDMKIVIQQPEVEFEYIGGFHYVPPSWSPMGQNVDLTL